MENTRTVAPLRKPDTNWLSVSDVEELSASIGQYGALSFDELTNISHAYAWNSALNNKAIALENIMREAGSDEEFIAYITEDINASKEMIGYGVAA